MCLFPYRFYHSCFFLSSSFSFSFGLFPLTLQRKYIKGIDRDNKVIRIYSVVGKGQPMP